MPDPTIVLGNAGLQLIPVGDPLGNGQESYEFVHRSPGSAALIHSAVYVQRYANRRLRFVRGNAPANAIEVFEIENVNGNDKVVFLP